MMMVIPVMALCAFGNTCQEKELAMVANSTWSYFRTATYENGITDDFIIEGKNKPDRTTPTNIAMYIFATSCARNLEMISRDEAESRCRKTLETLSTMERSEGFFLNWYVASTGKRLDRFAGVECPTFLSSVDNAWMAAALMLVKHEYPVLATQAESILEKMDFRFFYDQEKGSFFGGYFVATKSFTGFHYGILLSETRLINYVSAQRQQVDLGNMWNLTRERRNGILLSCYGSMFEAMVVPLFFAETDQPTWKEELGKYCLSNIAKTFDDFWGTSYCDDGKGIYKEFGVEKLAVYPMDYEREGVIAPYASFLALQTHPEEALANIRKLKPKCFTELGFSASFRPKTGEVSNRILTLDQGCILMSIADYSQVNPARLAFQKITLGQFPAD